MRIVMREVLRALAFIAFLSGCFFTGIYSVWKDHPGVPFIGTIVLAVGMATIFVGFCVAFSTRWRDGWK